MRTLASTLAVCLIAVTTAAYAQEFTLPQDKSKIPIVSPKSDAGCPAAITIKSGLGSTDVPIMAIDPRSFDTTHTLYGKTTTMRAAAARTLVSNFNRAAKSKFTNHCIEFGLRPKNCVVNFRPATQKEVVIKTVKDHSSSGWTYSDAPSLRPGRNGGINTIVSRGTRFAGFVDAAGIVCTQRSR